MRVIDLDSGKPLIDLGAGRKFFIGSVRKLFTVGELLNEIGPKHTYDTPIYRRGKLDQSGVLTGDLVLVASGDLTMGGRTNPDGTIAVSGLDHNEANSLQNAVLTAPDPLAGYAAIARQIAAAGIKKIAGDVVVDDRLFQPFNFRGEFNVRPIFVNDDVVDLSLRPATPGGPASVVHRPVSAAFAVDNALLTAAAKQAETVELVPDLPTCIGHPGCGGKIKGRLPIDFVPPLTNRFPLIRTFRIVNPSNYARTVLIEALERAGVAVNAPAVEENPAYLLPARGEYSHLTKVAELKGLPYSEDAKLILKISYNLGADTSLVLYGLTQGVDDLASALKSEKRNLARNYNIEAAEYFFVDGSGGGLSTATNRAVTQILSEMYHRPTFPSFRDALPILGFDGSLGLFKDFEAAPSLAGAKGRVHAKPGTFVEGDGSKLIARGQAFGGYIDSRGGKKLAYQLVVNEVPLKEFNDLLTIFQDEAKISALLWRDN